MNAIVTLEGRRLYTKLADGWLNDNSEHSRRADAEHGSLMLKNAILRAKGYDVPEPKPDPVPLKQVPICPACLAPVGPKRTMVAEIQQTVASYYSVEPAAMTSADRRRSITQARQVAMYLAAKLTQQTIAEIGRRFNRDHTTVLHAIKAVDERAESDPQLAFDVSLLRERLA